MIAIKSLKGELGKLRTLEGVGMDSDIVTASLKAVASAASRVRTA